MKTGSEVVEMDVKTRIMTIRLMDMLQKNSGYAETLGLEVIIKKARSKTT